MKKYWVILQLGIKQVVMYRGMAAIYLSLSLLSIFLSVAIWVVIYQDPKHILPESFSTVISYFFLMLVFNQLVQSFTAGEIAENHIKRGELSIYLLKPISYFKYNMVREIPWRIVMTTISIPVFAIFYMVFKDHISLELIHFLPALVFVVFAYTLSYFVQMIFASLTFWLDDVHGILAIVEVANLLFSGIGIPLFFYPPLMRTISQWLPFEYILFFPVEIAQGKLDPRTFFQKSCILFLWLISAGVISHLLWKKGLRKYTGEGI